MIIKNFFFVFDVETGGFDEKSNPLLSIAVSILDQNMNVCERFLRYIKPRAGTVTRPEALKVNGLNLDKLIAEGLDVRHVMSELNSLFVKYTKGTGRGGGLIAVGHNVSFDMKFLRYNYELHREDFDKYIETTIDTLWLSRVSWGYDDEIMVDFKLGTCMEKIGKPMTTAHAADADVESTVGLLEYHIGKLRGSYTVVGPDHSEVKKKKREFKF